MIDNKPQQNSLFQISEAKVLIPVWETQETDRGESSFLFLLVVILHQDKETQDKNERRGGAWNKPW